MHASELKEISQLLSFGDIKTKDKHVSQAQCVMVPDMPWRVSCVNKMELLGEKERNVRELHNSTLSPAIYLAVFTQERCPQPMCRSV